MLKHETRVPKQSNAKNEDETFMQKLRGKVVVSVTTAVATTLFLFTAPLVGTKLSTARAQTEIAAEQVPGEKKNAFGFVEGVTTFQEARDTLASRGLQVFSDSIMLIDENKNPLVPFAILCAEKVPYKFVFGNNKFQGETDLISELDGIYGERVDYSPPKIFITTHSVAESDSLYLVSATVPSGIPLVSVSYIRYENSKIGRMLEELSLGTQRIIDKEGDYVGASAIFQGSTNMLFFYGYNVDGKPFEKVYFWKLPEADTIYAIPSSEVGFDKVNPISPELLKKELIGKR